MPSGENEKMWPDYPRSGELGSPRLNVFLQRHERVFNFFLLGIRMATKIDDIRMSSAKALAETGSQEDQERLDEVLNNPNATFAELRKFGALQTENLIIRLTDNFLSYLSEIIQEAMLKKPEILRSSERISLEEVLRFSNVKDLTSYIVDKKINELSYSGLENISEFIRGKTNIELASSKNEHDLLIVGIELRNLYTHARGIVGHVTERRLNKIEHSLHLERGKRYHAEFDLICEVGNNYLKVAQGLDAALTTKYKIRRKRFKSAFSD